MLVEMTVKGLTMDPLTNMPIIILKDKEEKATLPIWVGVPEANAIMLELDNITTPRPMTHDLIKSIIAKLSADMVRIIINDLRDNTYFAVIELEQNGKTTLIDSRPSDAIALALRFKVPVFVDSSVLEKSNVQEQPPPSEGEETEQLRSWLESLKPEDFGKYKM